ncbi:MAG: SH3 domain-containing protein [Kofleriaceae bacterium]
MKRLSIALSVCFFGACVIGDETDLEHEGDEGDVDVAHDDDPDYDEGPADPSGSFNVGGWVLPADVRAIGDQQSVPYTGAGAWAGGANCGGGLLAGTREVGDYVKATFTGVSGYGGYACRRNTANSAQLSVHGTGRAIDIMIPMKNGDADNAQGDKIANFLVANAEAIGIQFIIWDRNDWGASRSLPKQRAYGGPIPHKDHLHVELSPAGARRTTPWFSDNSPPPPAADSATVTATTLNLRSGPATSYTIVTTMPKGATVTVNQGPSNGWYNVSYQGKTGWASAAYLAL